MRADVQMQLVLWAFAVFSIRAEYERVQNDQRSEHKQPDQIDVQARGDEEVVFAFAVFIDAFVICSAEGEIDRVTDSDNELEYTD